MCRLGTFRAPGRGVGAYGVGLPGSSKAGEFWHPACCRAWRVHERSCGIHEMPWRPRPRSRCIWLWPATSTSGLPISRPSSRASSSAGTARSWLGSPSSARRPAFLGASEVTALIVNANRLGLKGKVALRECRRISPSTAVVVVATTAAHGLKDALEGGATAFVSWPAPPEVLRRALRSGRRPSEPLSRNSPAERGGVPR